MFPSSVILSLTNLPDISCHSNVSRFAMLLLQAARSAICGLRFPGAAGVGAAMLWNFMTFIAYNCFVEPPVHLQ